MYRSIHAVALRTIPYNDSNSILSVWSAEYGRMAVVLSNASSPEARRRRAICMPLGLFEAQVNMLNGRDILNMRDVRPSPVTAATHSHPVRSALAMFFAEVLNRILDESGHADMPMYNLIVSLARDIDMLPERSLANLHLVYLSRLSIMLGIAPDTSTYRRGYVFHLPTAAFTATPPLRVERDDLLVGAEARLARLLTDLTPENMHRLHLDRDSRRRALGAILRYYSIHLTPMTGLRTLTVLSDLLQ